MSKKSTVYNALPIVAAAYGEKFGVQVVIGNDNAYTDGQTIVIPHIPDDYPYKDAVWGYLAHEAAHVRFTDFAAKRRPGIHAQLSNILEDCRIERAMMALFPGTAQTLNEVARYMAQAGHYAPVTEQEAPASILAGFCLYWLQTKVVGQSVLQPYLDSAAVVFEHVFPQGVVVRLNALLRKAVNTQSTAEAVSLADDILQMLREEKEKEAQAAQSAEEGQSQQNSADSPSQGHPSDCADEPNPRHQCNGGEPQSKNQQQNTAGGKSAAEAQSPLDRGTGQKQANTAKLLEQVLEAADGDLRADAHETLKAELSRVAQDRGDSRYMTVRSASETPNNPFVGQNLLREVKAITAKVRVQLYGLVQASQRVASSNRRSGKRVDARRLHRVTAGDTRVFIKPEARKRPNTAVHVLVDMSGSMVCQAANGKMRQDIAREASLAVAMALEAIPGVNPAVSFFAGDRQQPVFSVVKHGDRVQSQAGRFAFGARGGTPMAEAIWYAAFELSKTREERKMLLVVTDGEPAMASACHAVIGLCEQSGVEVVGIGIETTAVSALFRKHIVIDDVAALQRTLFKLMERSLTASLV